MSSQYSVINRKLSISLPKGQSTFLWGPRKVGKTTLIEEQFPTSTRFNFLETDIFIKWSKEPWQFRHEILFLLQQKKLHQPVILDEVQKIPGIMDEVQWLIDNHHISFILCGSSARKLRRSHANMLGGRAWRLELFPLTTHELGQRFDLLKALNQGLIPSHYLDDEHALRTIEAYINDYLKEEIQQEGLVRNLPAFARFLDAVAFSSGELVNYSNIGRDCGVDAKTVQAYFQILTDTLLGNFLEPFRKQRRRQIISATPKFYLFDVGVAGGLMRRNLRGLRGPEFGRAFEHFILMELLAYRSYAEKEIPLHFWRTKEGNEVDFVLDRGRIALEVKGSDSVDVHDLKGIKIFMKEYQPEHAYVVSQDRAPRQLESGLQVLPWQTFCEMLWKGEIF